MRDPNLQDFYKRVGRLQAARAKGRGFEAPGTLGRSHYWRPVRKSRVGALVKPVLMVAMVAFGMKGAMHYKLGSNTYEARVEQLSEGKGFDRLGGVLMAADPVTVWVSSTMKKHLHSRA